MVGRIGRNVENGYIKDRGLCDDAKGEEDWDGKTCLFVCLLKYAVN
jgi:hypothetical protein